MSNKIKEKNKNFDKQLKKQFIDGCEMIANAIEKKTLTPGIGLIENLFVDKKYGVVNGPNCAIGWVSVASGLGPIDGYELFKYFNIVPEFIWHENDAKRFDVVAKKLKKIAKDLK